MPRLQRSLVSKMIIAVLSSNYTVMDDCDAIKHRNPYMQKRNEFIRSTNSRGDAYVVKGFAYWLLESCRGRVTANQGSKVFWSFVPKKSLKLAAGSKVFWYSFRKGLGRSLGALSATLFDHPSQACRFSGRRESKVEDSSGDEFSDRYSANEPTRSTVEESEASLCALEISGHEHEHETESWELRIMASSRCRNPSLSSSDVISTVDFNDDGELFATGGIARKIRIWSYTKMTRDGEETQKSSDEEDVIFSDDDDSNNQGQRDILSKRKRRASGMSMTVQDNGHSAVGEICTPGKLSSLKWRPEGSDVIGCGDYDGVVSEWSIEHGHTVSERYEHSGQRVWSLDYSKLAPTLSASSSADGTVRLWSRGTENSVAILRPQRGYSVCCAEFSPTAQHLIAVASADTHVYLYDIRRPDTSLLRLSGHAMAASYVRFLGKDNLVSASVDSTLKLWDISASPRAGQSFDGHFLGRTCEDIDGSAHLMRTFSSHTNVRNFVGLSVHRGPGVLACGSETDEVFLYRYSSIIPLVRHKFPRMRPGPGSSSGAFGKSFVGAVCWREQGPDYSLVAANSEGVVQILQAKARHRR